MTTKTMTPAEFAKATKRDPKSVRRALRAAGYKRPEGGWKLTAAMQKKIAA